MPKNVDEQVVQLMLDSKEFDKNARKSINNLDDLKKALEFEGASRGFENINRAAKKVDFSIMENGIQRVQNHFNLLESVANTVTERITNKVIDSGERMIKSLTIDQISSGWEQYAERTTAVQRIMSSTTQQFEDQEKQMEAVTNQLEKLTWFTDETSYKFLDIVNSIGKFTANNIDLEESVRAMEGISTWASLSGASINEAGRAMYNLAQSMSVGYVMLMDWRSIQNANMATYEFQQTAIETALAMGTLTRSADGLYRTLSGKVFSATQLFSDGLQHAWFSADVLMTTLEKYGGFTDELNKFMNAVENPDFQTFNALEMIDDYIAGTLDMTAAMGETGLTAEELGVYLEKLGSDEMELGRRGFKAAQETKTFAEAIDYIKTAVSSGWAKSFEYIFGNYTEAKNFWSEVSEELYKVFVASGEARNGMLALWKDAGGRDTFLEGIRTLWKNVMDVLDTISAAWEEIFGKLWEDQLQGMLRFTEGFLHFAQGIAFTDGTFQDLLRIFQSILRVIRTLMTVTKRVVEALSPLGRALNKIAGVVLNLIANAAELVSLNLEKFFESKAVDNFVRGLEIASKVISVLVYKGIEGFMSALQGLFDLLGAGYAIFVEVTGGFDAIFGSLVGYVLNFVDAFVEGETILNKFVDVALGVLQGALGGVVLLITKIVEAFNGKKFEFEAGEDLTNWLDVIKEKFEQFNLEGKLEYFMNAFAVLSGYIGQFFRDLADADSQLRKTLGSLSGEFEIFWEWFKKIVTEMSATDLAKIGLLIVITKLIFGVSSLSKGLDLLSRASSGVVTTFNNLLKSIGDGKAEGLMSRLTGMFKQTKIAQIGIAAVMLASAFNEFNKMDYATTVRSFVLLSAIMGTMLIVFKKWNEISLAAQIAKKESGIGNKESNVGMILLEISGALLAVSYAVSNMAKLSMQENGMKGIIKSVILLTGVLVGLVRAINKMSDIDSTKLMATAGSLNLVATSLLLMTAPIKILSTMKPLETFWAVTELAVALLALGAASKLMEKVSWKTMLSAAVALDLLSVGLVALSAVVFTLSSIKDSWTGIGQIISLVVVLGTVIGALGALASSTQMNPTAILSMSAAFLSLGTALIEIGLAAKILQEVNLDGLGIALMALIGPLAIFTGILTAFPAAVPVLDSVATALMKFGTSLLMVAGAATLFALAFTIIQGGIILLGSLSTMVGETFPDILRKGVEAVGVILDGLLDVILELAPKIAMAVGAIILAVEASKWYAGLEGKLQQKVKSIGLAVIAALEILGGPLGDAIVKVVRGLNDKIPDIIDALGEFLFLILQGIGILLRDMMGGIGYMFRAFFTGEMVSYETYQAMEGGTYEAMGYAAQGVKRGAQGELYPAVEEAGKKAGKMLPGYFNDGQGASSPAKEFIKALGFSADGVRKGGEEELYPASEEVGTTGGAILGQSFTASAIQGVSTGIAEVDKILAEYGEKFGANTNGLLELSFPTAKKGIPENNVFKTIIDLNNAAIKEAGVLDNVKLKEQAEQTGEEIGDTYDQGIADGLNKSRTGGGGGLSKTKEAAKDYSKDVMSAIKQAYSDGIESLDLMDQQEELEYKLWDLRQPKTTEAEQKAYEEAKKQKDLERLDQQFVTAIHKAELANRNYLTTLKVMGGEAEETAQAYNEMLESRLTLFEYQSKRDEMATKEVESTEEAFREASNEINEWRKLAEQGIITNEMMLQAAKNRIEEFKPGETGFKNSNAALEQEIQTFMTTLDSFKTLSDEAWFDMGKSSILYGDGVTEGLEENKWNMVKAYSDMIENVRLDGTVYGNAEGLGQYTLKGFVEGMEKDKEKAEKAAKGVANDSLDEMANALEVKSPSKRTDQYGQWMTEGLTYGLLNDGKITALLNAADEIARKLLARLKARLGVSSPSVEGEWITKMVDYGMANGLEKYAYVVEREGNRMIENLLNGMKEETAQNGSEFNKSIREMLQIPDEEMHLKVVIDADDTSLNQSMSLLESLGSRRQIFLGGDFSGVNLNAEKDQALQKIAENDVYRATQLQNLYDLLGDYIDHQRAYQLQNRKNQGEETTQINNFTQNISSPKPVSALDTYRNTQKQFYSFTNKIGQKRKK